jgi:integrase
MPKKTKYPRLRTYVKRGKGGQVWVSYSYDMRGTGQRDIPLGTDYDVAVARWTEIRAQKTRIAGTIEEAMARYERDILPTLTPETRRGYTKHLRRIRPVFGPAAWESVKVPTLVEYLEKRSGKTQANRELALLSVIWNKARLWGMTELQWPAAGLERSKWKNPEGRRPMDVADAAFDAIYRHADQTLRDAMDLCSALGLRIRDALALQVGAVRDELLAVQAGKTGKFGKFDLAKSKVLPPLIKRRLASKAPHVFMLTCGRRIVTERMLRDRFARARALAAKEVPEAGDMLLRYMRKYGAQKAESLDAASKLLQHSSKAVTQRHYRASDTIDPSR